MIHEELVPLGIFWSGEWHTRSETLYASTIGRDRLERLRSSTYSTNQVFVNQSLHMLATNVLIDAKLAASEFWIDPALQSIIVPNAWFGTLPHREALRQIAEASLGQVYADRNGIIRIEGINYLLGQESFVSPLMTTSESLSISTDEYFQKDTPVKWGELANRIEVETQPLSPAALAEEVYSSNTPVSIEAGQTLTITVFYNQPPVIDALASLVNPPAGTSITGATYYAWGADVTVTSNITSSFILSISGRPLIVQNRNKIGVQDDISIRNNGLIRYFYPNNHLVQTRTHAQMIADVLLRLHRHPRRDLVMNWRGNPALLLGDVVSVIDHQERLKYWVVKQEIDYDGALRAKLEGRLKR